MSLQPFDRQVFAADGTWSRRPGTRVVRVQLLGGGSGGGGGARAATGANRIGGGSGGGGVYLDVWYSAADLATSVAVTIGTGGAGGAAATGDTTPGSNGVTGGLSRFGTLLVTAPAWQAAGGGSLTAVGAAGLPQLGENAVALPGLGISSFVSPNQGTSQAANNQPGGGSPGGGVASDGSVRNTNDGINNQAMGDNNVQLKGAYGLAATPVVAPVQLADASYVIPWYTGAGGGGSTGGGAGATGSSGGNGGDAQGYGAGGGGGGGSSNGFPAGTGGAGAPGLCIVTSFR